MQAGSFIGNGNSADGPFTTHGNWNGGTAPGGTGGDALQVGSAGSGHGNAGITAAFTANGLQFTDGSHTITGGTEATLHLGVGGITTGAVSSDTALLDSSLASSQPWDVATTLLAAGLGVVLPSLRRRRRRGAASRRRLAGFAAWLLALPAWGGVTATSQWSGSSGDTNWSNAANWVGGVAPASGADVSFSNTTTNNTVTLDTPATLNSLSFSNAFISLGMASSATLTLGAGGLTATQADFFATPNVILAGSQTWSLDATSFGEFDGNISESTAGSVLTKSGAGELVLFGHNTFTGGVTVADGTLAAGSDNALGTGPVSVQSGARLSAGFSTVSLANSVTLANGASLGEDIFTGGKLTFTGTVQVATVSPSTTITLRSGSTAFFGDVSTHTGTLTGAAAGTNLVLQGLSSATGGTAVIGGTVTNIASLTADNARLVLDSTALPAGLTLQSLNAGYVGLGPVFDGADVTGHVAPSTVLNLISAPANFSGTIGFDTDAATLDDSGPDVFRGAIDLSGFTNSGFLGLGTATSAVLGSSVVLTPPIGGDFRFGGGGGRLVVQAPLTTPTAGLQLNSAGSRPLTVVLQGTNTFGGNVAVTNGYLILDSNSAFPFASGQKITLGPAGYVGYTENWTIPGVGPVAHTPADLISLLDSGHLDSTGILGLDSSAPATAPRTVSDPINLSGLASSIYLGTTTDYLTLTGAITAAQDGILKLAGLNQGLLVVDSNLTQASGVHSVVIGHPDAAMGADGYVQLDGTNDYAGGTTLLNGTLYVGNNSALGSGPLTVDSAASSPALVPALADITLTNSIANNAGLLTLGGNSGFSLTLNGPISGAGGLTIFDRVTLGGSNTYSGGSDLETATVTVSTDNGLGSGDVTLGGSTVNFTSANPAIGSLSGYTSGDFVNTINLAAGSTLTVNQSSEGEYHGTINDPGIPGMGAVVVKTGSGSLVLKGDDTYSGGTRIDGGALVADASQALGFGPVTVGPGAILGVGPEATLTNSITLNGASGSDHEAHLAGLGALAPADAQLMIGAFAELSPGTKIAGEEVSNLPLLGQLTLGSVSNAISLTFGSDGTYAWGVQKPMGAAGAGYDTIQVNGSLAFTATAASPFTFKLTSFDASNAAGLLAGFDGTQFMQWQLLATTGGITGLLDNNYQFDVSGFAQGQFPLSDFSLLLSSDGKNLFLDFTPVPEPAEYRLMAVGLGLVLLSLRRRRRRRGFATTARA